MLHAESRVRFLEPQDEVTSEPCAKKMKSTEGAFEKLSDHDNQGIEEEGNPVGTCTDLIPVCISDNKGEHEVQKQEKILMDVLGTVNEVLPEDNREPSQPADSGFVQNINPPLVSINDTKDEEKKDSLATDNANEDNIKNSCKTFLVNRNESDGEFITSKEFIGPIYKPAESNKQDHSGSCVEHGSSAGDESEPHENRTKEKEAKKMQTPSSAVSEMDDELYQFYKEIHQLESENLNMLQEKETETSQEQYSLYNCSETSQEDHQHVLLSSPQPFHENGQCFSGEQRSHEASKEQQFVLETSGWKTENAFNGQIGSKYWNNSVPEFRPAWQSRESFIVPQGPPPPRLSHQSHFQILNSPPHKTNAFPSQNDGFSYENYYDYHGNRDINCHGPLPGGSTSNVGHTAFHSTQVFRSENNDQNGLQSNGFCEIRGECWKDPKTYSTERMNRFSSVQLPEERFDCSQKVLLILRGLPGSGKSTLSRILLGQSRDGIVLSTDDYFRQQDGYTYDAAQLGDAHDWNQKRAKQALEQGKSPVIIDNTNTQAWEMKPYVEVALEKGYRVEFHEPDTWWKFDPEELEKRNKHGVTREKIAQMLERYKYQISIPIVMNSVAPPHKHTQRPPLQRRHRERGHLLTKAKQRKKRKRNRKTKITEIAKKKLGGATHLIADTRETSESEEEDSEEETRRSPCTFGEGAEDLGMGCEERPSRAEEGPAEAASSAVSVPETSAVPNRALESELPAGPGSCLRTDVKPPCTISTAQSMLAGEEADQRHKENVGESGSLNTKNDTNCIQEAICSCEGDGLLSNTENKIIPEADMDTKLSQLNGEETEISVCHNSDVCYNVPESNTDDRSALKPEEDCSNAFFLINLSTELQQGFDVQISPSWSEGNFVGEKRQKNVGKPKQMCTNSSTEPKCHQSQEGLVKKKHKETVTVEVGPGQSSGLLAPLAAEVHVGLLVEPRSSSTCCVGEGNAPRSDAAPAASRRKRYRRIVNLAPKFNLPRQIPGSTEGGKGVPLKGDGPSNRVLAVEQKGFLHQDCGEQHERSLRFREYSAPYSGPEAPYSLPTPDADSPLPDASYFHLGQPSPVPKDSCSICIISRAREEQARTPRQQEQVAANKEGESERASAEVTSSQPDILSSVQVASEYPENQSVLESCVESVYKRDDPEPSEASPSELNQDAKTRSLFLGLPLSIGFAFQLVQLFGSPGLPLESLLPDDYVVPLDWKVSKMIYLLWKTSVEEKQKTNGLQSGNALADDNITLEDLNKSCQGNEDSSEVLPEMDLFPGAIEESITTCAGSGCLSAVLHQA